MTSKKWWVICSDDKCMHIHEFCCMFCQTYPRRCMITSHKHYTIYELQVSSVHFSDNSDYSTEHYPCFSIKRRNQKLTNTEIYLFFKVLFKIFTTGLCQRKVCYLIFRHIRNCWACLKCDCHFENWIIFANPGPAFQTKVTLQTTLVAFEVLQSSSFCLKFIILLHYYQFNITSVPFYDTVSTDN